MVAFKLKSFKLNMKLWSGKTPGKSPKQKTGSNSELRFNPTNDFLIEIPNQKEMSLNLVPHLQNPKLNT